MQNQGDLNSQRNPKKIETTRKTTTAAPVTESTKPAEEPIIVTTEEQPLNDQPEIITMMPLVPSELDNTNEAGKQRDGKPKLGSARSLDDKSEDENDSCENNQLKLILPKNDRSTCGGDMAKISIPISAEKLSQIPMQELLNLSSTRSTMITLQNLIELAEKYNL